MSRLGYDPIHKPYGNYSWQCGNLLFVVLANEDQCDGYGRYTHQIQWFDSLAENNTDKNIIVLSHHPLWGTTHGVIRTIDETESQRLKETLDRNPQVCAWFNGNIHENGGTTFHYNNCTCIDCDSINRYYGTQSFLWILTKENTSTQVFSYNHGLKAITYLTTVSLKYPFSLS